ncbi:MAG: redox-sensing transcriptional repressor Rex [Pirellulales bacterium]|nr:redox-sensing transcriptional repressor Rex [Planctomycetales bacterium]
MENPKENPNPESTAGGVPKAVISRLSLYLRELEHLERTDKATTSSSQLGSVLGFSDAQVRKDLAYFGQFGYPGIGYRCSELIGAIRHILGTDRTWTCCLVGVGNLGRALLGYKGFHQRGFRVVAAFDVEHDKVGSSIEGVDVYHLDRLPELASENTITLGVIAVPAPAAQAVADRLVEAGIEGILNFAPTTITLPDGVSHVGVDLAMELEQLCFAVLNSRDKTND